MSREAIFGLGRVRSLPKLNFQISVYGMGILSGDTQFFWYMAILKGVSLAASFIEEFEVNFGVLSSMIFPVKSI